MSDRNSVATRRDVIPPIPSDLPSPDLTANAIDVMNRRIVPRDDSGTPLETPQECFWRVAWTIAGGSYPSAPGAACNGHVSGEDRVEHYHEGSCERERLAQTYYEMMASRQFLPNSPCLVSAGRELGQLSACFVLPVEDSIESIFDSVKHTAMIHKTGGGTGFDFSKLRPAGSPVQATSGIASGPVTFMQVFDAATAAIKQGGTRRGANMGMLSVDHPDIWEFINLKGTLNESAVTPLENFNISVAVTDAFLDALDNAEHDIWKQSGHTPREMWDQIAQNAWRTGDPGVIFIDRMNDGRANPVPSLGPISATNPCGEAPLYDYDSCNLGSINLERFATAQTIYRGSNDPYAEYFDWRALTECVHNAVRFLDDVITVNKYPLPQIEARTLAIRRIGLGVMGWADALIKLGIQYDSPEAVRLAEVVMQRIQTDADEMSSKLAQERGNFPMWANSIYYEHSPERLYGALPMRNSTRTTIAPTGSISIIAGCSSGIEPIYAPVFNRRHKLDRNDADAWHEMYDMNSSFRDRIVQRIELESGQERANALVQDLLDGNTTITELYEAVGLFDSDEILLYRGANEIDAASHVAMQAAFQKYTDNAVSKTINLPENATWQTIQFVYEDAYESGCKGITVYRNNSRSVQVLGGRAASPAATEPISETKTETLALFSTNGRTPLVRTKLPEERPAVIHKFEIAELDGYIAVGLYPDGTPGEVFINASKQGSTISGLLDTIALLTSYALQYGIPLAVLADKMRSVRFEPSGMTRNRSIPTATSVVDYVFRWMEKKFLDPVEPATFAVDAELPAVDVYRNALVSNGQLCPDCGGSLVYTEGCAGGKCLLCAWSSC